MKLEFLGTGNCACVPAFCCRCQACERARHNPSYIRQPTCARITTPAQTILIDAGHMNLAQILEEQPVNRILLTHYHVDHVQGLFHLRWGYSEDKLQVLGPDDPNGCADLLKHPGILDFSLMLHPFSPIVLDDITVTPLTLNHSRPSLGYGLESGGRRIAWLSDTGGLPPETTRFLQNWDPELMIIDCTFPPLDSTHANHNDIKAVKSLHSAINPGTTCLTHISHDLDLWLLHHGQELPEGMLISYDRLIL